MLLIGVTLIAGTVGLKRFEAMEHRFEAVRHAIDGLRTELKHDIALVGVRRAEGSS